MSDKPIRISGMQAAEWGALTTELARDTIRQVIEEKTGKPHEWRPLVNMDAIELVPAAPAPPAEPTPFARVDFFEGNTICQFEPGCRDKLIRELLNLLDSLRSNGRATFVQAVEVEAVKA